jgi:transcriptional regulator with XRE-family HTH domain
MQHTFGRWLRLEIEERLMTQSHFAEKAGVDRVTANRWLHLRMPPNRGTSVCRIAKALGLSRSAIDNWRRAKPVAAQEVG